MLVKIDCEKGEGPDVAKRFDVRGYPTFYALNGDGEVVDRWIGYDGAEKWAATVAASKADPRTLVQKKEAYAERPTTSLAVSLANDAAVAFDWAGAVEHLRKARELDPASAPGYTAEILSYMSYGARGDAFDLDDVLAEAKPVMADKSTDPGTRIQTAAMVVDMARAADRVPVALPYLEQGLAAAEELGPDAEDRTVAKLEIDHALLVEKNTEKAVALRKATMPEGWQDDAGRLNQFAWWCFENDVNLDEAQQLAMRGVELAEDDAERANILDTAAEICLALGNCDEAVAHIKRAIELDPDKGYFKEQLVRFEQALREKQG